MSNIFKAYDVRGIYPDEIGKEDAYKIGFATVKFLQAKNQNKKQLNLVVGEDCRLSSPVLRGAVVDAVTRAGANVIYIGSCTSPLFLFSVNTLNADGGIMITASHLPSQYAGIKIVGHKTVPIASNNGLDDVKKLSEGNLEPAKIEGKVSEADPLNEYINFVIKKSSINFSKVKKLKIVIDASNGMKPMVLKPLFEKLGTSYTPLFFEIDCKFPNHSPDISKEEVLADLKNKVVGMGADIGIAFDGDGDRIIFVDEAGNRVNPAFILGLLFNAERNLFFKPKVVYDLRFSRSIQELLGSNGIKSRVGYVFIKALMAENDAYLGGETSGHFFFKYTNYAETTALVMLKILKILSESKKKMSELVEPFQKYSYSGEINISISSQEQGVIIMNKLKENYKDGSLNELDGVTVEYPDWWFNLRFSNTGEPLVRLVVEANTNELMKNKIAEITKEIKNPFSL